MVELQNDCHGLKARNQEEEKNKNVKKTNILKPKQHKLVQHINLV